MAPPIDLCVSRSKSNLATQDSPKLDAERDGVVLSEPLFVSKSSFFSHIGTYGGRCEVGVAAADAFTCRCFPSPVCLAFVVRSGWRPVHAELSCVHVMGDGEASL